MLTIMVDFTNASFPVDQPPSYYETLLFATEQGLALGSVAGRGGFFEENSLGQFRFTNAGVIGPFRAIDNPDTLLREDFNQCGAGDFQTTADKKTVLCGGREWSIRNAILAAAQSGFDFRQFDTVDQDGMLQSHELMIMVVFAKPGGTWGQNRGMWPEYPCLSVGNDGFQVCGSWVDIESDAGVATIAHELSHALGIFWEGYGNVSDGSGDENYRYSTMGATTGVFRDLRIWHLDPFAKFKLGWVEPKIIASDSSGDPFLASQCLVLPAIERARLSPLPLAAILYDLSRGRNEFFMLEYRRALDSNYDGRPWRTPSIGLDQGRGLAVWAIRTKANTDPLAIPSKDGATNCGDDKKQRCQDSAIHIYPPAGGLPRVGLPQPGRGLWTPADGVEGLYWVETDSNALSPFTLRVAGTLDRGSSLAVEVNRGSCLREFLLDRSFWGVPPGILSYDRRFLDDLPVPLVVHSWIHPRFRLERTVRQWVPPGDPVQVQWSLTPTGTEPTLARVRIMDDTPSGFIFNSDSSELIFDVRLNDGQTRTLSYELTPSRDLQSEGNFPVLSRVFFEAADGSPLDTPVELESFVTVFDPNARRNAGAPPDVIPSPLCGNGVRDPGEQCDDGNANNDDCCNAFCELEDLGTPTLTVSLSPNTLWPPNHKLVPVSAALRVGNTCDPNPTVQLVSITSNEPDNGLGDGDTANDIQGAAIGIDDRAFSLRAERSGKGNGRVYTATYHVEDVLGNSTTATGQVIVPKTQR